MFGHDPRCVGLPAWVARRTLRANRAERAFARAVRSLRIRLCGKSAKHAGTVAQVAAELHALLVRDEEIYVPSKALAKEIADSDIFGVLVRAHGLRPSGRDRRRMNDRALKFTLGAVCNVLRSEHNCSRIITSARLKQFLLAVASGKGGETPKSRSRALSGLTNVASNSTLGEGNFCLVTQLNIQAVVLPCLSLRGEEDPGDEVAVEALIALVIWGRAIQRPRRAAQLASRATKTVFRVLRNTTDAAAKNCALWLVYHGIVRYARRKESPWHKFDARTVVSMILPVGGDEELPRLALVIVTASAAHGSGAQWKAMRAHGVIQRTTEVLKKSSIGLLLRLRACVALRVFAAREPSAARQCLRAGALPLLIASLHPTGSCDGASLTREELEHNIVFRSALALWELWSAVKRREAKTRILRAVSRQDCLEQILASVCALGPSSIESQKAVELLAEARAHRGGAGPLMHRKLKASLPEASLLRSATPLQRIRKMDAEARCAGRRGEAWRGMSARGGGGGGVCERG